MAKRSSEKIDQTFTVHEVQHILASEGGELTKTGLAVEITWAFALAGALAWALVVGSATAFHLLVPMVAEYFIYLILIPLIQVFLKHAELRQPNREAIRGLLIAFLALVAGIGVHAIYQKNSFFEQWQMDMSRAGEWISGKQLHWPILVAVFHALRNLHRNVAFLLRQGPPFLGPGIGCGFRLAIFVLLGVFLPILWMIFESSLTEWSIVKYLAQGRDLISVRWAAIAWITWACLLLADLVYLWFRWEMQIKLKAKGHAVPPRERG